MSASEDGELLHEAIALHRAGRLEEAEAAYRAVLARAPEDPDALHFLGVLRYRCGAGDEAVGLIERALAQDPDNPAAHNNLGNILLETGRLAEAVSAYRRAAVLRPDAAEVQNNLGIVLRLLDRPDEARAALERAVALAPRNASFHHNLAVLSLHLGEVQFAIATLRVALALDPALVQARQALIRATQLADGRPEAVLALIRAWLAQDPDNPAALHFHAAYSGEDVPPRASDAFVRQLFNRYAGSFDAHLDRLGYRAPQLLADALGRVAGAPSGTLTILDAGCGTGLCGPLLRPFARHLAGVDLAEAMLARARERGLYDTLDAAELTAFIAAHPAAYDVILSADTLVYFGALAPVAAAAAAALRPGGVIAVSLERLDAARGQDFRLEPHGRYSHGEAYLRRICAAAGLVPLILEEATPRHERGTPVAGWVLVARKPAT